MKLEQVIYLPDFLIDRMRQQSLGLGKLFKIVDPRKALARLAKRAGLRALTMHMLRHSFITLASESSIDPYMVTVLAGHKSPGITARYIHISPDRLRGAWLAVAGYILGA